METARGAALAALKEHFRLDPTASTETVLVSRPLESEGRADDESEGVRGMISGSSNRHREIAQIRLVERGPDVLARVHVQVQRLDVTDRAAFIPQRAGDDRPSNLPTERYPRAENLTEQDWRNVGRNRQLELAILEAVQERLTSRTAEPVTRPG